jgi:hypothetical protein
VSPISLVVRGSSIDWDAESLMDLTAIAEEAIAAMNERDRVAAASGQGREDADIDVRG